MTQGKPTKAPLAVKDDALSACESLLTELLVNYLTAYSGAMGAKDICARVRDARDAARAAYLVDKEGG